MHNLLSFFNNVVHNLLLFLNNVLHNLLLFLSTNVHIQYWKSNLCVNFSSDYTVSVVNSELCMWEILFQYALSLEQGDNTFEIKDNSCSS